MDDQDLAAYLSRIDVAGPVAPDAATLRELHRAHQRTVPFENLSIHLPEPISLTEADLLDKIITRRRGGFCYELNGGFALLLEAIGFTVSRVAGRVHGKDGLGPPFDHLALIVGTADDSATDDRGPWLADVGFGSHSDYPLLLEKRGEQADRAGMFQLSDAPEKDVEVAKDGQPQYRIERRARDLAEFEPTCWWQQTWPGSHFRASTICSLLTPDGRISLSDQTLIRTSGGTRTEELLPDDEAVLAAYRDQFGVELPRVPAAAGAPTA